MEDNGLKSFKCHKFSWLAEWLILAAVFVHYVYFMNKYMDQYLYYDYSAELVAGNILAKEGGMIPKDWFFSTELRVWNVPQVFALFFRFSEDWHFVRLMGCVFFMILLILSVIFLAYQMEIKEYAPSMATCFALPFSLEYFDYVLNGLYYMPHIITALFTLGLILFADKKKETKNRIILSAVLGILAFFTGLGGMRMLLLLYIPMVFAACTYHIRYDVGGVKGNWLLVGSILSLIFSAIGAIMNNRLHSVYVFEMDSINFIEVDIQKLSKIIQGIMRCFGYTNGSLSFFSISRNALCGSVIILAIVAFIVLLKRGGKSRGECLYLLYALYSFIVLFIFTLFTDINASPRYFLPVVIFWIPLLFLFFKNHQKNTQLKIVYGLLIVLFVVNVYHIFVLYRYKNDTEYLVETADWLKKEGYEEGIASFKYANTIIELSNGTIDVWALSLDQTDDPLELSQWLQPRSHMEEKPKGRIFVVFSKRLDEEENCILKYEISDQPIFQNEKFIVYGYRDILELEEKYSGKW